MRGRSVIQLREKRKRMKSEETESCSFWKMLKSSKSLYTMRVEATIIFNSMPFIKKRVRDSYQHYSNKKTRCRKDKNFCNSFQCQTLVWKYLKQIPVKVSVFPNCIISHLFSKARGKHTIYKHNSSLYFSLRLDRNNHLP